MIEKQKTAAPFKSWLEANQEYLKKNLSRLCLVLQRRALWFRQQKRKDPLHEFQGQVISDIQADWLFQDNISDTNFSETNDRAKIITQTIAETKRELEKQSGDLIKSGTPSALDMLTRIFNLTPFDRSVLLLCLAPELDPSFERLYAYIQDDITCKYATIHLAISLFTEDKDNELEHRHSFLPESPLFKYKLIQREESVQLAGSRNSCPLRIDQRIANYLQGINRLDERLADIKPILPSESLLGSYEEIVNKLTYLIQTDNKRTSPPVFNFVGPANKGKKDIASKLCESLGIKLYELNIKYSMELKLDVIVPILERESVLYPFILYIDVSELDDIHTPSKLLTDKLIESLKTFFIIGSAEPLGTEREMIVVTIPKLDSSERSALWQQQLAKHGVSLDGQIDTIVEQFDFESDMIAKAITSAMTRFKLQNADGSNLSFDYFWQACREQSRNNMNGLAQRIIPCYTWDDIVLPEDIIEQLKDITAQAANRTKVYGKWGFGAKLNRGRGISALFSGSSGTGKTMAAEILANHLKLDLNRIDLSSVVSKYIGETEKNLRRVFDIAEQSGAILFFDEADALFGKRSEVKDSHDRYANIEINYLLQRMEDYRGLAILASNMKSSLDSAFLRRLRFHVEFPFPNSSYRKMIWKKAFPPEASVDNLDYNFLARLEIPGGNIRNITLNAAFLAAEDDKTIDMNNILRSTKREYAKIGRMVLESEFGSYYKRIIQ